VNEFRVYVAFALPIELSLSQPASFLTSLTLSPIPAGGWGVLSDRLGLNHDLHTGNNGTRPGACICTACNIGKLCIFSSYLALRKMTQLL